MTSTLHLSSLENSILTPASSITPSPPPRRYPTPTTPTSAATTTDFDHEIYLDLSLLILNKNSENLFKIQCKINQNILNLQIIKNFIINLLSKVPILIQNNQLTSEVVDGKYETYIFHENHILLSSSLEENQHKYENNENKIIFTVFSEFGFDSFLKNYENLNNFIFAIGSDANALYLYDNWFLSDTTSIVEAIRVIENRTAEYYSSNERSESSLKFMRNDQSYQDEEFIDDGKTPSPIPIKFKRDELKGICESISFVVAPRASLPSLLLRITVQTFRSSDSPSGKTYTIDKVFVRVDDHEWMLQYRYSGPHCSLLLSLTSC